MIVEKIIFSILAFYLFLVMFFKMIKKMDTVYVVMLILQAIGIIASFVEVIFSLTFNMFAKTLIYLISIVIPIIIIYIEHKNKNFAELIYLSIAKFYSMTGNNKKSKEILLSLIEKYRRKCCGTQKTCPSI